MSEASRLESLEKEIVQLRQWVRDLVKVVKENRQDLDSHEDQLQAFVSDLAHLENEVSASNERLFGEPTLNKPDSSSEKELSD